MESIPARGYAGQVAHAYVGTSGWAYPEWRGTFYPAGTNAADMLPFYSRQFNAVEINNSFYRVPAPAAVESWRNAVPRGFRFALKAPGEITHRRRLGDAAQPVARFLAAAQVLGPHLGPLLFQLPPNMRLDLDRLAALLDVLRPAGCQVAFEFRHASWFVDPVYELLRQSGAALCYAETDDSAPPMLPSAGFAYLRLRKSAYEPGELSRWRARFDELTTAGLDVYCFFKHEDAAAGPAFARQVLNGGCPPAGD